MAFEHELSIYQAHILEFLESEGQYVVIRGDDIAGPFETYEAALDAGYTKHGLEPFLVKQIFRVEPVHYFSRDLPLCRP